jgi:hypothetical protein
MIDGEETNMSGNWMGSNWIITRRKDLVPEGRTYYFTDPWKALGGQIMTESEKQLVATLGVYGCWILKHGKNLPDDPETTLVKDAYKRYIDSPPIMSSQLGLELMDRIDVFCAYLSWEKPRSSYEEALAELNQLLSAGADPCVVVDGSK